MDSWKNWRRKMEKALELFHLAEALSHLDFMITSNLSRSDVASLLSRHTLRSLPTLHYLTGFPYREEDLHHLERLIRIFTDFGYVINKTLPPGVRQLASHGITALMASVKKQNVVLVECLLRCGAKADIHDPEGFSPCHWAIKTGNLKCLKKLLEHGGPALVTFTPAVSSEVPPLLHLAVDNGHLEIVDYLLSNEVELGVDVNEEAFYSYRHWCFTPLARALELGTTPMIEMLMKHPRAKPSRFKHLHCFLSDGLTDKALPLLEYFSDEELSTDKVADQWALHTIDQSAFVDKAEYTKKVILEYVRRGWDPNSVSTSEKLVWNRVMVTRHTLLHLACLYSGREIIKLLVEDFGVDIDKKLEGEEQVELTPLMILLIEDDLECAQFLIEKGADLNARGNMAQLGITYRKFLQLMRRNLTGELELNSNLNAVELLVRFGDSSDLPLLDQVLARPDVIWHGTNEFHLAIEGLNPAYVAKVLKHCAKLISKEDLNWVTFSLCDRSEPEKVPCLVWLLERLHLGSAWEDTGALVDLIKLMVQLGYDLNSVKHPESRYIMRAPLIFHILKYDMDHGSSNLLRTILQFDHLQLNVINMRDLNPVEYLLYEWDYSCRELSEAESMCWKSRDLQQPPILETVKLLLAHGLDVSEMFIDYYFIYHSGFNLILKELCRAGAKMSKIFFAYPVTCSRLSAERDALAAQEIEELREWKEDFDRESGMSLKHISGLRVREMMTCVGDLKMLDELPRGLKETVLGTCGSSTVSREVPEEEMSDDSESVEDM